MASTSTYIGGLVFKDNAIDYLPTAEGRVTKISNNNWNYEYFMKDHLGSVRMSFDKDPGTGNARIIQENAYYSYGSEMPGMSWIFGAENLLKDNGKEQQKQWNVYDLENRFMDGWDPYLTTPDPRPNVQWSPYAAVLDNPVNIIDPRGDTTYQFNNNGAFVGTGNHDEKGVRGATGFSLKVTDADGNTTESFVTTDNFEFNDPDVDRKQLSGLRVGEKGITQVGDEDINHVMNQSGSSSQNLLGRVFSAFVQSVGGSMDFNAGYTLPDAGIDPQDRNVSEYDTKGGFMMFGNKKTAYNRNDAGQFLWGHAMKRLGFGYSTVQGTSHIYSLFANYEPDAPGDQKAIKAGYFYGVGTRKSNSEGLFKGLPFDE